MTRFILLLIGCLLVGAVHAEDAAPPKWGVLLPAISVTSDYRFNGISLSNRKPALQGSLHLWRPDGYYAGIWLSQVDFLDDKTSLELDSYIGKNSVRGSYETNIEMMYTSFNDNAVAGPTYDFLQLKTGVKRKYADLTLGLAALWSPSGSAGAGSVSQIRSENEYRISERVQAKAILGRRWAENGVDRTYWEAGLTVEWRKLDIDVRYSGTNLKKADCFYTDWCEAGLFAKLTLASY